MQVEQEQVNALRKVSVVENHIPLEVVLGVGLPRQVEQDEPHVLLAIRSYPSEKLHLLREGIEKVQHGGLRTMKFW